MELSLLRTKQISVIGAARSGIGVSRLLKQNGARVFVSDQGDASKLSKSIAELQKENIPYEAGNHTERVFNCSLMVLSPGVPSDAPVVLEAKKRGIDVVSELEVASWFCKAPIVAITGSNGKTTTTTLLGRIFSDAKKKHAVAGNIGEAFSNTVLALAETDVAVLEVSSFQLDSIESFHPRVSVILNITRNHMDRYENSMEKYAESKARIFINQTADDVLIYNADDELSQLKVKGAKCKVLAFSTSKKISNGAFVDHGIMRTHIDGKESEIIRIAQISIRGEHNLQNAMAATLAAQVMGVSSAYISFHAEKF